MKTHIELEVDKKADLVNLRTSMAIALLLVGAMLSPYEPLWGLGVELVAATIIVAVRRPWAGDDPVSSDHRFEGLIQPLTAPASLSHVQMSMDQYEHRPNRSSDASAERMLVPVFDVGADKIVGLRTPLGLGSISKSILQPLAALNRGEIQGTSAWVSTSIGIDELVDGELLTKVDLLLRASGLAPESLILEIERWHESRKNRSAVDRLLDIGIGIGLCMRKGDAWPSPPKTFSSMVSIYSVSASDITHQGEVTLDGMANVEMLSGTRLDRVVVRDVDRTALALDLGSVGLKLQAGSIFDSIKSACGLPEPFPAEMPCEEQ